MVLHRVLVKDPLAMFLICLMMQELHEISMFFILNCLRKVPFYVFQFDIKAYNGIAPCPIDFYVNE